MLLTMLGTMLVFYMESREGLVELFICKKIQKQYRSTDMSSVILEFDLRSQLDQIVILLREAREGGGADVISPSPPSMRLSMIKQLKSQSYFNYHRRDLGIVTGIRFSSLSALSYEAARSTSPHLHPNTDLS